MPSATAAAIATSGTRAHAATVGRIGVLLFGMVMLVAASAFVAYRLTTPSDGTTLSGASPWSVGGVTVSPLPGTSRAILPGDIVAEVDGRSIDAFLAELFDPSAVRSPLADGMELPFSVERGADRTVVPVQLGAYPLLPLLADSWALLLVVLTVFAVGTSVFLRRPREPAARALFILGTAMLASTVSWLLGLQVVDLLTGTGFWLYMAGAAVVYTVFWAALLHFALVFPRPMPQVERRPWLVGVAYAVPFGVQLAAIAAGVLSTQSPAERMAAWLNGLLLMQAVVVLVAFGLIFVQYRRSDAAARGQLRWVALAGAIGSGGGFAFWFGPELLIGEPLLPWSAAALVGLPFPLAIAAAIHRHRLFDMSALVNRSLVYAALTLAILVVYSLVVALLGALLPTDAPYAVTLLAIGAAAVAALPMRDRLQRAVNRLMYGERDEPYRVIARLGERLESSPQAEAVLPAVVDTVAHALRLPYVAISLDTAEGPHIAAAHGTPNGGNLLHLPLVHQGETVGELVLAPRSADETFGAADLGLLTDLARQAGAAAYGVRLAEELQHSRERLVTAREEERRRLRRDLHDELGPTLAGSLMKLEAARSLLPAGSEPATLLLGELAAETRRAIEEVRRLARDLRPPALDELGLVAALEEQAGRFSDGVAIEVEAPDDLPPLSAAAEVAAFRIALEALTNVVRHSSARRAWLRITVTGAELVVEVHDDGRGVEATQRSGVGWTSMRERAAELGGSCQIGPSSEGGTHVMARLPLGDTR
jgi:two-component system, NarL family, sensor kinase